LRASKDHTNVRGEQQGQTYLFDAAPAQSDEALLEAIVPAAKLETDLAGSVRPLVGLTFRAI
jgi:hypothetical protein